MKGVQITAYQGDRQLQGLQSRLSNNNYMDYKVDYQGGGHQSTWKKQSNLITQGHWQTGIITVDFVSSTHRHESGVTK